MSWFKKNWRKTGMNLVVTFAGLIALAALLQGELIGVAGVLGWAIIMIVILSAVNPRE